MAGQKASPAARFVGGAAALTAVLLAGLVIFHLAVRRERAPRPPVEQPSLAEGPVDRKEKILHREFLDGRTAAEVRAERYFQDPDGRRHLEGGVEVKDYAPDGTVLSLIAAEAIVYDRDLSRFELSGRVAVTLEDLVLEGGYFEYDKERGVFETRRGGVFTSSGMSGEAAAITHDRSRGEVLLSGGFRIVIEAPDPSGERSVLTGGTLRFLRRSGHGEAAGGTRFARGPVEGTSENLSFTVEEGGQAFDSVTFSGKAGILLAGPSGDLSGRRTLEADDIAVTFLPAGGDVETVEARGNARLSQPSAAGGDARLSADAIRLSLDGGGEVRSWSASGGFRLELEGQAGQNRTVEGERASGDGGISSLAAESGPGRAAVLDSERLRVEAAALRFEKEGRDFDASGGVKCLFKPRPEGAAPGFFSGPTPLYVSARAMERREETDSVRFEGHVRAWQDARRIAAEELDMDQGTGEVRGRGGVTAAFPGPSRNGAAGEPIEAGGEDMRYVPEDRALLFRRKGYVRMPGAELTADEVSAVVEEEGGGLETLTAKTGVVVSRGRYEGRGRQASYDAAADRIVLVGNPVLVDREGRVSRGSKLTFDLGDGKIRLENEGQGRSVTIIKS